MTLTVSATQLAQLPSGGAGVLFWASIFSLVMLLFVFLFRQNENFAAWVQKQAAALKNVITPPKRMAKLNKVVCYYCEKGRGIYNPVYRMLDGVPHVEGTCTHCNRHITVRLRG